MLARTSAGMSADLAWLVHLFGHDRPDHAALTFKRLHKQLIGPLIEFLNGFPLHIRFTGEAKRAMEGCLGQFSADDLTGEGNVSDDLRKLVCQPAMKSLLLQKMVR